VRTNDRDRLTTYERGADAGLARATVAWAASRIARLVLALWAAFRAHNIFTRFTKVIHRL
jgi:hypothetical protein